MKTNAARTALGMAMTLAWIGAAATGCSPLDQQFKVSVCGGFSQQEQSLTVDPATYCDAEVLHWRHDAATGKLTLSNTRVTLNCCGEHSMTVDQDGETYVATERDAPEEIGPLPGMTARCDCMCVYDFEVAVGDVPAGVIALKLVRDVTDAEGGKATVWQGQIDLGAGQGEIVIDASASDWCQTEAN